jgi:hypothetical protein
LRRAPCGRRLGARSQLEPHHKPQEQPSPKLPGRPASSRPPIQRRGLPGTRSSRRRNVGALPRAVEGVLAISDNQPQNPNALEGGGKKNPFPSPVRSGFVPPNIRGWVSFVDCLRRRSSRGGLKTTFLVDWMKMARQPASYPPACKVPHETSGSVSSADASVETWQSMRPGHTGMIIVPRNSWRNSVPSHVSDGSSRPQPAE